MPVHISDDQRRVRLGGRHHLARAHPDLPTVAGDLVGLHSTDPASVMLAARARVDGVQPADVEAALYDDRSLARVLGMRRTMFVVPRELVPELHAGVCRSLVAAERRRSARLLEEAGDVPDGGAWLDRVGDATVDALRAHGPQTAGELKAHVPDLDTRIVHRPEKRWGGEIGMSTRVLFLLATGGRIVRARPRGSWLSSQYAWADADGWFGGDVDVDGLDTEGARAALARRWLATYGPGTTDDLQWWTGWNLTQTRTALAAIDAVPVTLDGGVDAHVLPEDDEVAAEPEPWVALLPALDPTTMGWKHRDWYLSPEVRPQLFDGNGNAGPTVWVDGRVVGGWTQRDDGEVVTQLLEDLGGDVADAVEAEAAAVHAWLDGRRVVQARARGRTPLEAQLLA